MFGDSKFTVVDAFGAPIDVVDLRSTIKMNADNTAKVIDSNWAIKHEDGTYKTFENEPNTSVVSAAVHVGKKFHLGTYCVKQGDTCTQELSFKYRMSSKTFCTCCLMN